ncbi:class I SAM-dependent DNA methyltransferase [Methylobacterium sp. Leaf118]|uniref:class I SAM-dependent DNA methyltransferase n=1 Tax=Methylobacterium sp. Leaf118 TaxID=2876562 RepID=UPI001E3C0D72|nr:SAM-dependent methyltransferase [Methylobacterium sp. Leaf118]
MGGRHEHSLPAGYFDDIYAANPDPWQFTSSAYERAKYDATLEALPRARYGRALEVGCSIGVFTRDLAERCAELVALDPAPAAIEAARERCAGLPHIRFALGAVPATWPPGRFDLIVLSEVLYFLDHADLSRLAGQVGHSLEPGGDCVLVHWLGETDYPLSGDEAVEGFIAASALTVLRRARTQEYRLDLLRAGHGPD